MAELSITSYAKINLSLRILRQREDGYHDIETILQTIDLADHLNFTALETTDIQITVSGADVPTDESNLCFKAAILLREVGGAGKGCRIHIEKKIPLGAGLGGGSSNA
ncbi:MAG TPA: 4-(cytidine 5'-diphospho)-2-C-methyl-D-erythritol kinase, partial [Bacteroidetes bacterium]|nr:4-(cytidine 5'-diphospho)-2-C-methyl-D-erythritol kinase [Bacteroidota bacterium]